MLFANSYVMFEFFMYFVVIVVFTALSWGCIFLFFGSIFKAPNGSIKSPFIMFIFSVVIGGLASYTTCTQYTLEEVDAFDYSILRNYLKQNNSQELHTKFKESFVDNKITNWEYFRLRYMHYETLQHKQQIEERKELEKVKAEIKAVEPASGIVTAVVKPPSGSVNAANEKDGYEAEIRDSKPTKEQLEQVVKVGQKLDDEMADLEAIAKAKDRLTAKL